ncbi:peptidase M50 [uncultured Campylobacter sp.]|uniref:peptidase M50 n=1 Tax=uncultured Campylobacter sp. TaxID=218934 RepID=UPI002637B8D6|nr:peptidase M50 [uncultured Campylobacter sp.]
MLLNTFAPPFKLVGGYFIAGICFLIASIPAFFAADFEMIAGLETAGFLHIFFVGFVMSIIIGALYQLTSVILEKPFSTIKGAMLNLAVYCVGIAAMGYGMISGKTGFIHGGGMALFLALLFFGTTYIVSFMDNEKKSFAAFMLFVSAIFLLAGISLGFCLLMILSGTLPMDFMFALKFHVYFVLGFVFFIIVGVATVLLPMFALAHDLKFTLSKFAFGFYILAGVLLFFSEIYAYFAFGAAIICFVAEALYILKKRVRKAYDYWNVNIALSLVAFVLFCVLVAADRYDMAVFMLIYGFLFAFIAAHLYKIAPFLIWYHYVAPFVGKTKVPLLDQMILKKPAYIGIGFNALGLALYELGVWLEIKSLAHCGVACLLVSIVLVAINVINVFKFTKFGIKEEK